MKTIHHILRWAGLFFYAGLTAGALGLLFLFFVIFQSAGDLPKLPHPLARIIETPPTEIYAASGEKLITLGRREPVPLSRISPHFINAIVAVEDHRFMSHGGFSKLSTLRALQVTLMKPGRIQGASTITQQLAKNLFFSFEKTWMRKFKELLVALQIEYTFSKEEILHAYVNQIAFGAGAQGVERASRIFWGKPAADLTLGEAAFLAGLPQSPSRYNPYRHYDRALKRRDVVIRRMVAAGYLSQITADKVLQERPRLASRHADSRTGSYFIDTVIAGLIRQYDEDVVFHGGIKVTTTMNVDMQRAAEQAMDAIGRETHAGLLPPTDVQAALVAVDTGSGAVKALLGGRDYYASEFNRAVFGRRPAGMGLTPFLYYTAMEQSNRHGGTMLPFPAPPSPGINAPPPSPENPPVLPMERILLKQAFRRAASAHRMVQPTDPDRVLDILHRCGIPSSTAPPGAGPLNRLEVSPMEMAAAYAVLASGGVHHPPFFIRRVTDTQGQVLYDHLVQGTKELDAATTFQVVDMMRPIPVPPVADPSHPQTRLRPAAGFQGKITGGTDDWFTGFTPGLSTAVWVGYDNADETKTRNNNEGAPLPSALSIWNAFTAAALKGIPAKPFPIPDGISFKSVDPRTGCLSGSDEAHSIVVPLKPGQTVCGGSE